MFGKLPIGQARIFTGDNLLEKAQTNPDLYGFLLSNDIYNLFVDTNGEGGIKILNDDSGGSSLVFKKDPSTLLHTMIEDQMSIDTDVDDDEEETKEDTESTTNKPINVKPKEVIKYVKSPPKIQIKEVNKPTIDPLLIQYFKLNTSSSFEDQVQEILKKSKNAMDGGLNATKNKMKLEKQHNILLKKYNDLGLTNNSLKDKIGQLEQQISLLSAENTDKSEGLEKLKGLQNELFNTQQQLKNTQNDLSKGKQAFGDLKKSHDNLKNELSKGKNAFNELKNKYNQGKSAYNQLRNNFNAFKQQTAKNQNTFKNLKSEYESLSQQNEQKTQTMKNEYNKTIQDLINNNAVNKIHLKELKKVNNPPQMLTKLGGIISLKHAGEMFSLQQALNKHVPKQFHKDILSKVHTGEKSVHEAMLLIMDKSIASAKVKKESKFQPKHENKFLKRDNMKKQKIKPDHKMKNKKKPKFDNSKDNIMPPTNTNNKYYQGNFNKLPSHGQLGKGKMPNLDTDEQGDVQIISSISHQGDIDVGKVKQEHFDKKSGTWKQGSQKKKPQLLKKQNNLPNLFQG